MKRLANNVKGHHPTAYRPEEIEVLMSMLAAGASAKEVALVLGRSRSSVYVYCHKHRLSLLANRKQSDEALKRKERRVRQGGI